MREQASPAGGWLEALRRATAVLGFAIAAVLGAGLMASFVNPMAVEQAGRDLIRAEVQRRVGERIEALAAVGVAGVYLFGQNWLHTLVFGDYLGWGYLAWLGGAFAGLLDIGFNRARVSTWLLNKLAKVLGASVQALPC